MEIEGTLNQSSALSHQPIARETDFGPVHLSVTDSQRALRFWRDIVGLEEIEHSAKEIHLGTPRGKPLVVLYPGARGPFPRGRTGLYHLALAVPDLGELARTAARLSSSGYPYYPTDHVISKSLYLWDLDGNGIEIYMETPQDGTCTFDGTAFVIRDNDGRPRSGRDPIDMDWLVSHMSRDEKTEEPLPDGTTVGHVHLHVSDLDKSMYFYHNILGFEKLIHAKSIGMSDVTVNGYIPHRMAFNTWAGKNALPAPASVSGLRHFTIQLPTQAEFDKVVGRLKAEAIDLTDAPRGFFIKDPSQNQIHVTISE